jgi:tryptophanyl-tRNA synthetase
VKDKPKEGVMEKELSLNNQQEETNTAQDYVISLKTFEAAKRRSNEIYKELPLAPSKYKVLTGDRPTGSLHIGHLFGSLQNRVRIQNMGVTTFILIADYQVFTDRETAKNLPETVKELILDYLAVGLTPNTAKTFIFCHSQVPELNQLLLSFFPLISIAELDKNPTVKEEIRSAKLRTIPASMYTYPVHQAADILFCKANLVPVGKDQLPHLEVTRKIARRFNERFSPKKPIFPAPDALLSDFPVVLGLDGEQKMSKSRGNAIFISDTADVTKAAIKKAKTDSERLITYDPEKRPEVSNLLRLAALCSNETPQNIADKIGDGGAGKLKQYLTDALNAYLEPIRQRRAEFAKDLTTVADYLKIGNEKAREEGAKTLNEVRAAMNMVYF